jgi:hypothetical protein
LADGHHFCSEFCADTAEERTRRSAPDALQTRFDRTRDQPQVVRLLQAGCTHMRKAFDIEDINLDELIATALDDPQALSSELKAFRGINFADMQIAYRQFCDNEKVPNPVVDLGEVIDFYNEAVADLPDHTKLLGLKPILAGRLTARRWDLLSVLMAVLDITTQARRRMRAAAGDMVIANAG